MYETTKIFRRSGRKTPQKAHRFPAPIVGTLCPVRVVSSTLISNNWRKARLGSLSTVTALDGEQASSSQTEQGQTRRNGSMLQKSKETFFPI